MADDIAQSRCTHAKTCSANTDLDSIRVSRLHGLALDVGLIATGLDLARVLRDGQVLRGRNRERIRQGRRSARAAVAVAWPRVGLWLWVRPRRRSLISAPPPPVVAVSARILHNLLSHPTTSVSAPRLTPHLPASNKPLHTAPSMISTGREVS